MTRRRHLQRGFTLIELLIAITLLGLILTMLFSALHLAGRAWNVGSERSARSNDMRLVENLVRRAIGQIQPVLWSQAPGGARLSFNGERDAVAFTGPLPAQAGGGGLFLMSLELQDTDEGKQLILRRKPYRPDDGDAEDQAETTVLVSGLTEARFEYFGSEKAGDPPQWTSDWRSPMRLPQLVRLSLSIDQQWPDVVAAVRNDAYAAGIFPGGAAQGGQVPKDKFFLR
jgi:general secretion pathway protein J